MLKNVFNGVFALGLVSGLALAACERDQKGYGAPGEKGPAPSEPREREQGGAPAPAAPEGARPGEPREAPREHAGRDLTSAVDSIAQARCAREERCKNVGQGRKYATQDACIAAVKKEHRD